MATTSSSVTATPPTVPAVPTEMNALAASTTTWTGMTTSARAGSVVETMSEAACVPTPSPVALTVTVTGTDPSPATEPEVGSTDSHGTSARTVGQCSPGVSVTNVLSMMKMSASAPATDQTSPPSNPCEQ